MRRSFSVSFWVLLVMFMLINVAYLHRVPGLMGDEASEGENVYELLVTKGPSLMGERSYIGPAMDFVRVPFVVVFGYSAIALRLPMFIFSVLTFVLGVSVLKKTFADDVALVAMAVVGFSPIYVAYQRLGWAITLLPFFTMLVIWLLLSNLKHRKLLVGLAAGLGLHNHILFLPVIAAIAAVWVVIELTKADRWRRLLSYWPAVVGLCLVFSTQVVVLRAQTADQGDPGAVANLLWARVYDLPKILPLVVSGSSYVARYTGVEFAPRVIWLITLGLIALVVVAAVWSRYKRVVWLWLWGWLVHLAVLLVMVDRFTLRYFVITSLGVWLLAGVGAGELVQRVGNWRGWPWFGGLKAIGLAGFLMVAAVWLIFRPFLLTGGSVADFSLGNRTNSAAALVDTRPLVACLRGKGTVTSEGVHIFNRLQFLGHYYDNLTVLPEDRLNEADYLVHYRWERSSQVDLGRELCPNLKHFIVEENPRREGRS